MPGFRGVGLTAPDLFHQLMASPGSLHGSAGAW